MLAIYEEIDKLQREVEELQKQRDSCDPELKEKQRQLSVLMMSITMSYY